MSRNSHYDRAHLAAFPTIARGAPKLAESFFSYYGAVFQDGALSVREKKLVALSVAHAIQCPYCIDAYTSGGLESGADLAQMTEAVHVASAVRARSVSHYGVQMALDAGRLGMSGPKGPSSSAYFDRQNGQRGEALEPGAPNLYQSEMAWLAKVYEEASLSTREKRIIGLAVAHALQCPYSIDEHTRTLVEAGEPLESLTEAVHVACAIRGGAALVHGIQMLQRYDSGREDSQESVDTEDLQGSKESGHE